MGEYESKNAAHQEHILLMGDQGGPDWVMGTVEMAAICGLFQRVRWRFS